MFFVSFTEEVGWEGKGRGRIFDENTGLLSEPKSFDHGANTGTANTGISNRLTELCFACVVV